MVSGVDLADALEMIVDVSMAARLHWSSLTNVALASNCSRMRCGSDVLLACAIH